MCLGYSSACGVLLIRFSYMTNISRLQQGGVMQTTYKSGSTYKKYHLTSQLIINNTNMCFNGELLHRKGNYFDTTVDIRQPFSVVQKKPKYILKIDTSDADLSFILGSTN